MMWMENKLWIYSFPELYRVVGDMQIVMIFVIIADAYEQPFIAELLTTHVPVLSFWICF